jgi:hypothetical protein
MGRGMKELVLRYFEEVANDSNNKDPENLAHYAQRFVDEVWRWISARLDFREEDDGK